MGYPRAKSLLCVTKIAYKPLLPIPLRRRINSVMPITPKNTIALAKKIASIKVQETVLKSSSIMFLKSNAGRANTPKKIKTINSYNH